MSTGSSSAAAVKDSVSSVVSSGHNSSLPLAGVLLGNVSEIINSSSIQDASMAIHARGPLQRWTDPLDLQSPWAALIYLLGDCYIFFIMHMICHKYFTVAIEMIMELTQMNEDVAGATLMAIGTSFPELISGIMGVFVPGAGEAGLGTVVGSLVFNLLVVNGACIVVFPEKFLQLSRAGVFRDVFFQAVVIIAMVWAFWSHPAVIDESIAFSYIGIYIGYTLACWKGPKIVNWYRKLSRRHECELGMELVDTGEAMNGTSMGEGVELIKDQQRVRRRSHTPTDEDGTGSYDNGSGSERAWVPIEVPGVVDGSPVKDVSNGNSSHDDVKFSREPTTILEGARWIFFLPLAIVEVLCMMTIPDCKSAYWKRCLKIGLPLSILGSIVWISALVFVMMEWAMKAGRLVNVDSAVMGLIFCAVGTSMPDCMCSIIVAQKGKGEMAISNVFGSNVFDILIALGVPWALKIAVSGSVPPIEATSFMQSAWILGSILLTYAAIVSMNHYKLPRWSGYLYLAAYAAYTLFVVGSSHLGQTWIAHWTGRA